jgi:hypothetical protein
VNGSHCDVHCGRSGLLESASGAPGWMPRKRTCRATDASSTLGPDLDWPGKDARWFRILKRTSPIIRLERDPERLVLQSGPATVVLNKLAGKATLDRKHLPWAREPVECPLSLISGARVSANIDASSQVEICSVTLVMREGDGWVLSAEDKQHATAAATAVREFLGIAK